MERGHGPTPRTTLGSDPSQLGRGNPRKPALSTRCVGRLTNGMRQGRFVSFRQRTKSLRDSLLPNGLSVIPRGEIVGSGGSALS